MCLCVCLLICLYISLSVCLSALFHRQFVLIFLSCRVKKIWRWIRHYADKPQIYKKRILEGVQVNKNSKILQESSNPIKIYFLGSEFHTPPPQEKILFLSVTAGVSPVFKLGLTKSRMGGIVGFCLPLILLPKLNPIL